MTWGTKEAPGQSVSPLETPGLPGMRREEATRVKADAALINHRPGSSLSARGKAGDAPL